MRPRATFLKRDREQKLKQKAVDKAARKAARQNDGSVGKGPPIDWASMNDNTASSDSTDVTPVPPSASSVPGTE